MKTVVYLRKNLNLEFSRVDYNTDLFRNNVILNF